MDDGLVKLIRKNLGAASILAVSALAGCGGSGAGSATTAPANLTTAQAMPVISSFLNTPAANAVVQVGFSPLQNIICDERGILKTTGADVCVRYNPAGGVVFNGSPNSSPDGIDFVLDMPQTTDAQIRNNMIALDTAIITPTVLTPSITINNSQLGAQITASFQVKNNTPTSLTSSCAIKDNLAALITSFNLVNNTLVNDVNSTMDFPINTGFSLIPGQYTIDCNHTNSTGVVTSDLAAVNLQIVNTTNTAPSGPTGVALVNGAALLKDPTTNQIRDINGIVCVNYVTAGTDIQDNLLGLPLLVEGFNDVNGTVSGPFTLIANSKQNCTDISTLGGQNVTLGFKSKDSNNAYSGLVGVLNTIDLNNAPAPGALNNFDGAGVYTCVNGSCVFPTLTAPVYTDAENDTITKTIKDGVAVIGTGNTITPTGLAIGTHNITVSAADNYGATSGASSAYVITVNANLPPVISGVVTLAVLLNSTTNLGGSCTDPESGVLPLTPISYVANTLGAQTIVRTCSDGFNTPVTVNQTVNVTAPVNQPPVISGVTAVSGLMGSPLTLGGACNDPESGVLALTPTMYTPNSSLSTIITRTCTDGVNPAVTKTQSVTGTCSTGLVPDGAGGCIPGGG